jgi:hypothetical protein
VKAGELDDASGLRSFALRASGELMAASAPRA